MQQKNIRIADYNYHLPDERIARHPLAERDASKLLIWQQGAIQEDIYYHIDQWLPPETLLVFNNTRVIPARLILQKPEGGVVELFCLEPAGELSQAMAQRGMARWKCLVGGAKKWKSGAIMLTNEHFQLTANKSQTSLPPASERGTQWIDFQWQPAHLTFSEVISAAGQVPLPPYLQRPAEAADKERYQTIYARTEGSVAAPTAGLHFTERIFEKMQQRGMEREYVTLHVGAGTFKPVQTETIGDHEMHAEYFEVSAGLIRKLLKQSGSPVVAVGTTSLRTLESLYLLGNKLKLNPDLPAENLFIHQWDAFNPAYTTNSVEEAYQTLIDWMEARQLDRLVAKTQLLIAPGYTIRTIDALVTNFHQPASTLLLLVAALTGDHWREIYEYALRSDFRFLSYGDGALLFR